MDLIIAGALSTAYLIAATFFLKFWADSRDRLFGLFAAAFLLLAAQRLALPFVPIESADALYIVRLIAFVLIIVAIVDKNRAGR